MTEKFKNSYKLATSFAGSSYLLTLAFQDSAKNLHEFSLLFVELEAILFQSMVK